MIFHSNILTLYMLVARNYVRANKMYINSYDAKPDNVSRFNSVLSAV